MRQFIPFLFFAATVAAQAATISGVSVTNNSSPDSVSSGGGLQTEFKSNTSSTPVQTSGNAVFFSSRLSFVSAMQVQPGGPTVALIHRHRAYMEIAFTVEDPTNIGYTLNFDSVLRGYSTARLDSGIGAQVSFGVGNAFLSVDGAPGTLIGPLSTLTAPLTNNTVAASTLTNETNDTATYTSGAFSGTKTFRLQYAALEDFFTINSALSLQNSNTGEVSLRFGENVANQLFQNSATPGPDGTPASSLGLTTTVTANFNGPISDVPEPATVTMAGLGLLGLFWRAKRQS